MRLLVLSNGHGEDTIALRILQALQQKADCPELSALPIVGEGRAYTQNQIALIGSVKTLPSGGFLYMDGRQLARDLRGGLVGLTLKQLQAIRKWGRGKGAGEQGSRKTEKGFSGQPGFILAVGDIVPLLFAWLSGMPYAFLGTAKSEYYVRDEQGLLPRKSWWDDRLARWLGSIYLPWERWLLSRPHCKVVFCRDELTADRLKRFGIPALHLGNPMMDGLEAGSSSFTPPCEAWQSPPSSLPPLTLVLLPGSRPPEAYANWKLIVQAVMELVQAFADRPLLFLGAIAPSLSLESLRCELTSLGWQQRPIEATNNLDKEKLTLEFTYANAVLFLTQHMFGDCLHKADFAIAMAGTATEQFIGLGKPAMILPGEGPQFTPAFAEAQTRLLGPSVILVNHPQQVSTVLRSLLEAPDRLHLIAENGFRRMGQPGAAARIATYLSEHLLRPYR
jgi:uncharacterized protein (TIGR03492 family)